MRKIFKLTLGVLLILTMFPVNSFADQDVELGTDQRGMRFEQATGDMVYTAINKKYSSSIRVYVG